MIEENQIVKAVSLINKLTKQGEITWKIDRNPSNLSLLGEEHLNGLVYSTIFKEQLLRLFRYDSSYYTEYDTYAVSSAYRLSFIEHGGHSLWDFPNDRIIEDLYETVRFKTSNVEKFFGELDLNEIDEDDLPF